MRIAFGRFRFYDGLAWLQKSGSVQIKALMSQSESGRTGTSPAIYERPLYRAPQTAYLSDEIENPEQEVQEQV